MNKIFVDTASFRECEHISEPPPNTSAACAPEELVNMLLKENPEAAAPFGGRQGMIAYVREAIASNYTYRSNPLD